MEQKNGTTTKNTQKSAHSNNSSSKSKDSMMMGVGIAALVTAAAAAAGTYFLYGTEKGKKTRKDIKSWVLKMKADVMDKMEAMKDWSEESYNEVVDTVVRQYEGLKHIDRAELAAVAQDLKKHWKNIKRHVETGGKKPTNKSRSTKPKILPAKNS